MFTSFCSIINLLKASSMLKVLRHSKYILCWIKIMTPDKIYSYAIYTCISFYQSNFLRYVHSYTFKNILQTVQKLDLIAICINKQTKQNKQTKTTSQLCTSTYIWYFITNDRDSNPKPEEILYSVCKICANSERSKYLHVTSLHLR